MILYTRKNMFVELYIHSNQNFSIINIQNNILLVHFCIQEKHISSFSDSVWTFNDTNKT